MIMTEIKKGNNKRKKKHHVATKIFGDKHEQQRLLPQNQERCGPEKKKKLACKLLHNLSNASLPADLSCRNDT